MSCERPLLAVKLGLNKENGKMRIKIQPKRPTINIVELERKYGASNVFMLPCGSCTGCKLNYRKEISTRCVLEASLYECNSFVTLTYDDGHNPGHLKKSDLQKFFKRVRKDNTFRYYACGEYGSTTHRPHYHVLMFGYRPKDLKFFKEDNGNITYTSKELNRYWPFGTCLIGDVTQQSASYVAGYVGKKVNNTGFTLQSLKPGIGESYFVNHFDEIYKNDNIVLKNGSVVSVPAYCDVLAQRYGYDLFSIKDARLKRMRSKSNDLMRQHGYAHREMTFNDSRVKNEEKMRRLKRKYV